MADGMDRRGPAAGEVPDEGGADGAERAFEALRAEVTEVRGAVAALLEQARRPGQAGAAERVAGAPDYSPTLGAMAQELKGIKGRLRAMEGHPALLLTPEEHAAQVAAEVKQAREDVAETGKWASKRLATVTGELQGIVGQAHDQLRQRRRQWGALAIGAVLGAALWWPLLWVLPWGLGHRLASTLVSGEGRWRAGQVLMGEANPEAWERTARLSNACPEDTATDLCVAALAAKAVPPGPAAQPAPGEARTSASGTVSGHSRVGR